VLDARIAQIVDGARADDYTLYLTEGPTFRDDIAVSKPYKGTRSGKKPFHFENLTAIMVGPYEAVVCRGIEADDQLALDALADPDNTVICSRDKDLKQLPVNVFSWELGKQPAFGPTRITQDGTLQLNGLKLTGTGFAFFCAQMLMGDTVDNIPGVPGCGPVKAYQRLEPFVEDGSEWLYQEVEATYRQLGEGWEDYMLEQGRLLWMTRRLNPDGTPELWERGMIE
jgi:hypothetical protein